MVIDEIRGRQEDPASVVHERAWSRFFGGPLGHPICGTIRSLREMTSRAVRRFIARQFVPANMALALVGGVAPARVRRALARAFPAAGTRPTPCPRLPPRSARGTVRLRRRDLAQSYLVRIAAAPPDARSVLALSLAIEIVGADPDARLFQEIRERLGLGYDVGASVEHGADWAVAVISASAAREHEDRLLETVERTCRDGRRRVLPRGAGAGAQEDPLPLRPARRLAARAGAGARRARRRPPAVAGRGRPGARRARAAGRRARLAPGVAGADADGHARGLMRAGVVLACLLVAASTRPGHGELVAARALRADRPAARGDRAHGHPPATPRRHAAGTPRHGGLPPRRRRADPVPGRRADRRDDRDGRRTGAVVRRSPRPPRPRRPARLHGLRRRRARARWHAGRRAGTRDPHRRSARPSRRLGLSDGGRFAAPHGSALRRVRRRARWRRGRALPGRHGGRAARRVPHRARGTARAEPRGRPAAARRSDPAHRPRPLGDLRARRSPCPGRMDGGAGAGRAPLAALGRHRPRDPALRWPGAHLLLCRPRLRARRAQAALLALGLLQRHHRDGRRRPAGSGGLALHRAGSRATRLLDRRPHGPARARLQGPGVLVRAGRRRPGRSWWR